MLHRCYMQSNPMTLDRAPAQVEIRRARRRWIEACGNHHREGPRINTDVFSGDAPFG